MRTGAWSFWFLYELLSSLDTLFFSGLAPVASLLRLALLFLERTIWWAMGGRRGELNRPRDYDLAGHCRTWGVVVLAFVAEI